MIRKKYVVNDYAINLISGFITHRKTGETKRLGEYQLKLITVLLEHVGEILSRDEITDLVWHRRVIGNNSLPNAIHTLRVALGDENKQQRIIQTIPKLGYLLDPAFCEIIEEEEEEEEQSAEPPEEHSVIPQTEHLADNLTESENDKSKIHSLSSISADESPLEKSSETTVIVGPRVNEETAFPPATTAVTAQLQGAKKHYALNRWVVILLVLLLIIMGAGSSYFFYKETTEPNYQAVEQDQGMYSNIRIFQLVDSQLSSQDKENLNRRLKETFYVINKQLKPINMHITVYYFVSLRRLDVNFSIESTCENKQLAMTIYHWRQSEQSLNNLIYQEMGRKINEMAHC